MSFFNLEFTAHRYNNAHALFTTTELLTVDWDFPGCGKEGNVEGVYDIQDVIDLLQKDTWLYPEHIWELQETGHGAHAVLLCNPSIAKEYWDEWYKGFLADPMYWTSYKKEGQFNWRITPKYPGEIVVLPLSRIGKGKPDPEKEKEIEKYYEEVSFWKQKYKEDPSWFSRKPKTRELPYTVEVEDFLEEKGYYFQDWTFPVLEQSPLDYNWYFKCTAYYRGGWFKKLYILYEEDVSEIEKDYEDWEDNNF